MEKQKTNEISKTKKKKSGAANKANASPLLGRESGKDKSGDKKAKGGFSRPRGNSGNNGGRGKREERPTFSEYGKVVVGEIIGTSSGYAFAKVDERDDIFIPASCLRGAMHKDKVEIKLIGNKKGGGEGEVVNILSHGLENIVGVIKFFDGYGVVSPMDRHIPVEVFIPKNCEKKAKDGDIVVARIDKAGTSTSRPRGYVNEVLGSDGGIRLEILSIIRSNNLYETFPSKVEAEAAAFGSDILASELEGRTDFRQDTTFTIDGEDAKDFDDAVSVTKNGDIYNLRVHIADVSHYVKPFSELDKEAFKRGTSVYFPSMVLPMLPEYLSNGLCSLKPNEDRLTLSVEMNIDKNGKITSHKIARGIIRSSARLTYNYVASVLDGNDVQAGQEELAKMFFVMRDLADILYSKRKIRGAVEFDLPESNIILDENDKVSLVEMKERLVSHKIIEEFMLAANETVAEQFAKTDCPFIYRAHENPPAEKIDGLNVFLDGLGLKPLTGEVTPLSISQLLAEVDEDKKKIVNKVVLRSMAKAKYIEKNLGHFGLAADFYCHFTSPIRRYPDLFIHRIIKEVLLKKDVEKYSEYSVLAAKQSTERERLAETAERDVDDLLKAEYMKDHIGEEYTGAISGVTEWGVFVELPNSVEGLIRVENLGGFGFIYDDKTMTLANASTTYRFGQSIDIVVDSVTTGRVAFRLKGVKPLEK